MEEIKEERRGVKALFLHGCKSQAQRTCTRSGPGFPYIVSMFRRDPAPAVTVI